MSTRLRPVGGISRVQGVDLGNLSRAPVPSGPAPDIQVSGTGNTRTFVITNTTGGTWDVEQTNAEGFSHNDLRGYGIPWNITPANARTEWNLYRSDTSGYAVIIMPGCTASSGAAGNFTLTFQSDPGVVTVDGSGLT